LKWPQTRDDARDPEKQGKASDVSEWHPTRRLNVQDRSIENVAENASGGHAEPHHELPRQSPLRLFTRLSDADRCHREDLRMM
jgi:hypothetical protein